jgi:hypothetical protein
VFVCGKLAANKRSSLFAWSITDEENIFYKTETYSQIYKTVSSVIIVR